MNPSRPRPGRLDGQRGSATAELVIITPVLIALLLLVVALGRSADARLDVDSAARAASLARSPAQAQADAATFAGAALDRGGVTCRSLDVGVDLARFRPGGIVAVTVTCTVDLSDLTLLRLPGSRAFTSGAVAVIDTFRETR